MRIRPLETKDRQRIEEIVTAVGNFNQPDIEIAMELIDDAISKKADSDYIVYVLEDDARIVQAYVCFGKTPLTDHTYDFYWMAIDPQHQRRGLGLQLFQFVEGQVRERGGKLLMCETSSQESYERVVRLYQRLGYQPVARIKNFYRDGDDKLIYMKELSEAQPEKRPATEQIQESLFFTSETEHHSEN
jgi:ribosomal protein S18 acetylase RimI-like enzyme